MASKRIISRVNVARQTLTGAKSPIIIFALIALAGAITGKAF